MKRFLADYDGTDFAAPPEPDKKKGTKIETVEKVEIVQTIEKA
jgi:hypothetical protein